MKHKRLALLLSLAMTMSAFPFSALGADSTSQLPFTDLSPSDQYYPAVSYAWENQLMSGTSASTFSPDVPLTRAMLAQILFKLEQQTGVSYPNNFTDVSEGQWYSNAVNWIASENILSGYTDGRFGLNDPMSGQEVVSALAKYEDYTNGYAQVSELLSAFSDSGNISRGEASQIMMTYLQNRQAAVQWEEEDIFAPIDPADGIQMLYQGYYEEAISLSDGSSATAKVYIPDQAEQGSYFVLLTVPDGMETEDFLKQSGWMDLADQEQFCLFVMESPDGTWSADYIKSAYAALVAGKYYLPFPTFYVVGYGTGGTALQEYIMTNAITVAGAVFINASDIDQDYLTQTANTQYGEIYDGTTITYGDVTMPVWIIDDDLSAAAPVVNYWKQANDCVANGSAFSLGATSYRQSSDSDSIFTPCGAVSQVVTLEEAVDITDPSLAQTLYRDFLSLYTRYGGNFGGNTLAARPDYDELGVDFYTMNLDGYLREYLVYVPERIASSGEAAPMVISMHGANQTYKMMFDISRWWEVADKYGFILVMPNSTLNPATAGKVVTPTWNAVGDPSRANDVEFLKALVNAVKANYAVDNSKIYLSGQSNGSMMTNYMGMMASEYFTAMASTSGPVLEDIPSLTANAGTTPIPLYLLMGEFDFWNWSTTEEGVVRNTISYWLDRNQAGDVDAPDSTSTNGRYTTSVWYNDNQQPMYEYTQTSSRGHSFLPEEMEMMWLWLSQWSKDGDSLTYTPQ